MVKVYTADAGMLKDEKLYRRLYADLDSARQNKADRFLFEKDRRLCVAAGALLKKTLEMEGIHKPFIENGKNGKPHLVGEDLYFNLSHSKEMVMCAIAKKEVGCDVEKVDILDRRLAEYVMTASELEQIYESGTETEQEKMFFRFWTLKESYMKATGLGIGLEPGKFCMVFGQGEILVKPPADEREFWFKEYFRQDGYCYACCSLSEEFCDTMVEIDLRKI